MPGRVDARIRCVAGLTYVPANDQAALHDISLYSYFHFYPEIIWFVQTKVHCQKPSSCSSVSGKGGLASTAS